jgi:transcription-repair coupling factor (superfamily II helicase)
MCEKKGEFSIRGDIVEVFPINKESVYRLDFFGDYLEEIRGENNPSSLEVVMATDIIIEESEVATLKEKIKTSYKKYGQLLVIENARSIYYKLTEKLETSLFDDSLGYIFPIIKNSTHNLQDIFGENLVICFDESKLLYENLENLLKEHENRCESLFRCGDGLDFIKNQFTSKEDFLQNITAFQTVAVQTFKTIIPFFSPLKTFNLTPSPIFRYSVKPDQLVTDCMGWQLKGYKVILCSSERKYAEKNYYYLKENKISCIIGDSCLETGKIYCTTYNLDTGFIYHDSKIAVIGVNDLFFK